MIKPAFIKAKDVQ